MAKYYIEAEVSCVRLLEIDADSDAQAIAAAQDYMGDHMADASQHSVGTEVQPSAVGSREIDASLVAIRQGEPGDYYGYTIADEEDYS
jgi:hypothetical protein